MGDRMPSPNAWRPMHPQNMGLSTNASLRGMGLSTNASLHGMGPPMLPRSGEMALPTNAGSDFVVSPIYSQVLVTHYVVPIS